MNKFTKTLVVASVVTAPAIFMFTPASAQVTGDTATVQARWGANGNNGVHASNGTGAGMGMGRNVAEDAAAFLNISIEEVKAARDEGVHIPDLIADAGQTLEEWHTYRQSQMAERLAQAVADGKITAERAEQMQQRAAERHAQMLERMQVNQ